MTPKQVLQRIKTQKIEFVDCRFMDFPGLWQHITFPAGELKETTFKQGFGFDGSCIRGWEAINEQDMLIVPVADTAHVDPFPQHATLALICDVKDPVTKKQYSRDPRSIGRKAVEYIKKAGIADKAMFGPEIEFFVFDNVHYGQDVNRASYAVDSVEGSWNSPRDDPTNMGYQVRRNEGYFPCPPMDTLADLRSRMCRVLADMGVPVEGHHHEVATGGQCEIDLEHQDLLRMADICMMFKYVVKNVAVQHGKVATFMPKPLFMDNGSGMHTHFSLWKAGKPLFPGNHYGGLSKVGLHAIGGLLRHAKSLLAFTNPTTNSYKRLVPGYEAPVKLVYSTRNRAALIRIPRYSADPKVKRLEFRSPDASCNPYLAFAAMTMAAADGIKNKLDPGNPVDKLFHEMEPHELQTIDAAPADLEQALTALENDHDYLLQGNVFTKEVIQYWIKYKRENEVDELRHRPHPHEFSMYFDI